MIVWNPERKLQFQTTEEKGGIHIIDLRSDTLTLPDRPMLECILSASFGDSGRLDEDGWGGDPSVNMLEKLAAELTGKERAILLPSGTMGNHVALLTYCRPGDPVLVDTTQHLYRKEAAAFDPRFGQLKPVFYHLTEDGYPDTAEIEKILEEEKPKLLCIENTHNHAGGTYIPYPVLAELRKLADQAGIPVHMDGARLFNAAIASGIEVSAICGFADTVMFCLSKGVGAPVGSLLCGSREFIAEAAATRKLLGGSMRQAGVFAAMGHYALTHHIADIAADHRRARLALDHLRDLRCARVPETIQSNILCIDISESGLTAEEYVKALKERGVWLSESDETHVRMVLYKDVTDEQVLAAAAVIKEFDRLTEQRKEEKRNGAG